MQHRIAVAQSLHQVEPAAQQGIVDAEDLRHATGPSNALGHVLRKTFGCQARGLGDIDIGGPVPEPMQLERGVRVFGDRFDGDATDFHQGAAPQDGAGPAEEAGVPEVVAVLDQAVKERTLVRHTPEGAQVALEGVCGEEVMRCLDQCTARIGKHGAHRQLQERAHRQVIAVEDGNEVRAGPGQGLVEISRLGMPVVGPVEVPDAHFGGEFPQAVAVSVVKQMDVQPIRWPVKVLGRQHRGPDHRERFVVGRDVDVDVGPVGRVGRQRFGCPLEWPGALDESQHHDQPRVALCAKQDEAQHGFPARHQVERLGHAPPAVTARSNQRQRHEQQGRDGAQGIADGDRGGGNDNVEHQLRLPIHGGRHRQPEAQATRREPDDLQARIAHRPGSGELFQESAKVIVGNQRQSGEDLSGTVLDVAPGTACPSRLRPDIAVGLEYPVGPGDATLYCPKAREIDQALDERKQCPL